MVVLGRSRALAGRFGETVTLLDRFRVEVLCIGRAAAVSTFFLVTVGVTAGLVTGVLLVLLLDRLEAVLSVLLFRFGV